MQTGRSQFKKFKGIIQLAVKIASIFPLSLRLRIFYGLQNSSGKKGIVLRYIFMKSCCKHCGDNVMIAKGCFLFNIENLYIGDNVSIHPMSYIDAEGGIEIGDNVSIAHQTTIMSSTHSYWGKEDVPIKYQPMLMKKVSIGSNVWIGAKAMIMAGINIGGDAVIGAGSKVTHDVESSTVVAGNPAKKIKNLFAK